MSGSFDAKREASCRCAVDLKIFHVLVGEEFFDGRLEPAVGNEFLRDEATATSIGFERSRTSPEFFRKSRVIGVTRARLLVYIDRTGLRQ